jgi:hypothetical protein
MRNLRQTVSIGLAFGAAIILPVCLQAQAIHGPVLGFVSETTGTAVRPLLGVPGASSVGDRLPLNMAVRRLQVAPKQDYLLALGKEGKSVFLFDLAAATLSARPLAFPGAADLLSISPTGSAAAIYDSVTRRVYAVTGLPRNPGHIRTFDASQVSGRVSGLSVTDDGALALVRTEKGDSESLRMEFTIIGDTGISWRVPTADAAVGFVPGRRDIVVADNLTKSVFLVTDIGRSYARLPLFAPANDSEVFSGAAMSEDASRVFVATQTGTVAIMEVGTGRITWLSCECRPTTLEPLKGGALFRLTEVSATEPIVALDVSSPEPRFVLTPPNTQQ